MAQPDVLKIPLWGKFVTIAVTVAFEAIAWYVFVPHSNGQGGLYAAWTLRVTTTVFSLWMIPHICRILSTELSSSDIRQVVLFANGRFGTVRKLAWQQVHAATFQTKHGTYKLDGPYFSVFVAVNFLSSATAAIRFVHAHLPEGVAIVMI